MHLPIGSRRGGGWDTYFQLLSTLALGRGNEHLKSKAGCAGGDNMQLSWQGTAWCLDFSARGNLPVIKG